MTAPRLPQIDPELKDKLLFTALAILIYRVGAHITAPSVNVQALSDFLANGAQNGAKTLFNLYDTLGGGLSRATIFALGIMPYISASIVFQLGGGVIPAIAKMQKDEEGRKQLTQWTRYLTVAISFSQAYTFTLFVESIPNAVPYAGFLTRMIMVATLTIGAIFIMWLGEQITERGIGNGMSLLITISILDRVWPATLQAFSFIKEGVMSAGGGVLLLIVMIGMITAVVAMTIA
ncbi:MAG: preprotein translocase subunit SecY, partial [Gemmatimonadales bacterium]